MTSAKITLPTTPVTYLNVVSASGKEMKAFVNANGDLSFIDDAGRGMFGLAKGQWNGFVSDEVSVSVSNE